MEYADCIRDEALGSTQPSAPPSVVISVDADEELLVRLKHLGVSSDFIAGYENARQLKLSAAKKRVDDRKQGDQLYLDAAEQFREIADIYTGGDCHPDLKEGDRLALYYARMNEAICLMSVGTRELVTTALHIYKHLEGHYPDFPLLKMRIGQAYGKLGQFDLAIAKIRESGALASNIVRIVKANGRNDWPDSFPKVDYEHFEKSQPKLLGYYLWSKTRNLGEDEHATKAALFLEAYNITKTCLTSIKNEVDEMVTVHNNLLYYAIGYLTHTKDNPLARQGNFQDNLNGHLAYIEHATPDQKELDIDTLDTVVRAYAYVGRAKEAKQFANILIDKCLADKEFGDAEIKIQLIRSAKQIINTGHLISVD